MGDIRNSISKNIITCRKKGGLTQSQLANHLGVKTTTVSSWERGANSPDIETLYKACRLFGLSLDEMYGVNAVTDTSPLTIAAHFDGADYTPEEMEEINQFAEFVKKRKR